VVKIAPLVQILRLVFSVQSIEIVFQIVIVMWDIIKIIMEYVNDVLMNVILVRILALVQSVQLVQIQLNVILVHQIYSLSQTVNVKMVITKIIMEHVRYALLNVQLALI